MLRSVLTIGCILLALGVWPDQAVAAQDPSIGDPYNLQLFSAVDRQVASVGESLVFLVECWASPMDTRSLERLERQFEEASLWFAGTKLELVRVESLQRQYMNWVPPLDDGPQAEDTPIVLWTRRFILRATEAGPIQIPNLIIHLDNREYATGGQTIHSYHVPPGFRKIQRSVFPIVAEVGWTRTNQRITRIGSAFLLAEDVLVTSYHVVVNAHRVRLQLPNGKRISTGKVWGVDPLRDVAILHINPREIRKAGLEPLQLAPTSNDITEGKSFAGMAFTSGWPGAVQHSSAGVLSDPLMVNEEEVMWVSSNRVRPGDSGGPLLDRFGRVLGVVSAGLASGEGDQMIHEGMSIATDPRPAMVERLLVAKPMSFRNLRKKQYFATHPHARAIRALASLTGMAVGRQRGITRDHLDQYLAELESAVNQADQKSGLHFARGSVYKQLGSLTQALDAYKQALDQFDDHFPAAYALASCLLEVGAYDEAAQWFRYVRRFDPYAYLATYGLAHALIRDLQYEAGLEHIHSVLQRDSNFAPALFLYAKTQLALGEGARAQQVLVKLEHISPGWGRQLQRMLYTPLFRPFRWHEMPLAQIRAMPGTERDF
jgi:hypothetical protein